MVEPETSEKMDSATVGRRIRSARARAGMTRKQLALASGASERYLAQLEAGTGNPSVDMLIAIAGALHVAMAELLPWCGERSELRGHAASVLRRLPHNRLESTIAWMNAPGNAASGKGNRVALIGLRGAGKSTLGAALAERLSFPFFEISKEVERAYGGAINLLIEIGGQAALRRYEADVLETICREHPAAIIAAPGGIVADGPLFDTLLASSHSIWLEATPEDHMARVIAQGDLRPMAGTRGAMEDLQAILAARSVDYGRADARLNTSLQSRQATIELLVKLVSDRIT